jgi:ATP-dependent DNA helicase DinG
VSALREAIDDIRFRAENFFLDLQAVLKQAPVIRIRSKHIVRDTLSEQLALLRDGLLRLKGETFEEEHEIKAYAGRAEVLAAAIRHNLEQDLDGYVYWAERENKRVRLVASPVEIAPLLRETLFGIRETVVLTSATLSAAGSFAYIRGRLGMESGAELLLDSPFDFEEQSLLYIAPGLGDQQAPGYQERFEEHLGRILSMTRGRTLVLFTSYYQLRRTAERMKDSMPDLVFLCQGEMPAYRLIERFKELTNAVLLGTASFWQGIDIPGDALECVVIAKLPFAVPDDPIVEARMERLKNPFWEYQVPQAMLLFRQGFGRLIRTRTDRGAVVVLDSRVATKRYGQWFLRSIPNCPVTDDMDQLKRFFDRLMNTRT